MEAKNNGRQDFSKVTNVAAYFDDFGKSLSNIRAEFLRDNRINGIKLQTML
jgi:hypothetical protein